VWLPKAARRYHQRFGLEKTDSLHRYYQAMKCPHCNQEIHSVTADPERILFCVSRELNIPIPDMMRRTRKRPIVRARYIAISLMVLYLDSKYRPIAELFGYPDHTTIVHAMKTIKNEMEYDDQLVADIQTIKHQL